MTKARNRRMPILLGEMDANRAALDKLMQEEPKRQPERISTAAAIAELAPKIRALLKAGHSLADIAACVTFGGRSVSAQQLRRYLAGCEKRLGRKGRAKKTDESVTSSSENHSTSPVNSADGGTTATKAASGSGDRQSPLPPPARLEAPARNTAPLNAGVAAHQTTLPLSDKPQGTTGSPMRDVPTVQAPTIARTAPPTAVSTAGTTGIAMGTLAKPEASPTTIGQDHRTTAPNPTSTSTTAKPQSTASPELPGLSVEAAQRRSIDRLLGTARPANVEQPRQSNLKWELGGHRESSSADATQTEPPLVSTTQP